MSQLREIFLLLGNFLLGDIFMLLFEIFPVVLVG